MIETFKADNTTGTQPVTTARMRVPALEDYVPVRISYARNPLHTFSVIEPGGPGGCSKNRRTKVTATAQVHNCIAAGNAGYFNVNNGACIGNIITNGVRVQTPGTHNVNFGIRRDGTIVVGYLQPSDLNNTQNPFVNLVAGVVWLVRNGENYVDRSAAVEDMSSQTTGNTFLTVQSARAALGHDQLGRLVLVQVDGKSWERGVSLYQLADLLITLGVKNGINLDGGGSMTSVFNGALANIPSDSCPGGSPFFCEREVSTAVCFHDPFPCLTPTGKCECPSGRSGPSCDIIQECDATNRTSCGRTGTCHYGRCVCNGTNYGKNCQFDARTPNTNNIESLFDGMHVVLVFVALIATGVAISLLSCVITWFNSRRTKGTLESQPTPVDPEEVPLPTVEGIKLSTSSSSDADLSGHEIDL